jgi:short-subunit dehydrogenase
MVIDAINRIVEEKKRIDVVINNAGYALVGALEETSMHEIREQFETNFWRLKSNGSSNPYNEKTDKR